MTEASPLTHVGYLDAELYRPDSIGHPVALTECRVVAQSETDFPSGSDASVEAPGVKLLLARLLLAKRPRVTLANW